MVGMHGESAFVLNRRRARIRNKRIEIEGQMYLWSEEGDKIAKRRNF